MIQKESMVKALNNYNKNENFSDSGVIKHFKKLSAIPRGSKNEGRAADMIEQTAVSMGLFCVRDSADNVFIRVPASKGLKNVPSLLLQGHIDMVCEKNADSLHDFLKDPIRLIFDGDLIRTDGTTLGADDGIAVAMMLELITDQNISHGPLELLFTTGEEIGLTGMKAFDKSLINSRMMINLDSEEDNQAIISCAGGVRSDITLDTQINTINGDTVEISITGLSGGHSGTDINSGRTGAVRAISDILKDLYSEMPFSISSIDGGGKDNAIPRECQVVIVCEDGEGIVKEVGALAKNFRNKLCRNDFGFKLDAKILRQDQKCDVLNCNFFSNDNCNSKNNSLYTAQSIINLISDLPCGVISMSEIDPSLPLTSANLASVHTENGKINIVVSSRSSSESQLDEMQMKIESTAAKHGASAEHRDRYPGWDYEEKSNLKKIYTNAYEKLFKSSPIITGIHAGLECGIVKSAVPDMDIISIGPNAANIHTPDETLSISSSQKIWELLKQMLSDITQIQNQDI